MDVLRTPDDRFSDLPGYPFDPHHVDIPDGDGGTLRVHHVDEGAPDAPVVLLLHGEPSWSYLYRHMIPLLVDALVTVKQFGYKLVEGHENRDVSGHWPMVSRDQSPRTCAQAFAPRCSSRRSPRRPCR